jgi:ubiquinone/menaquinone biosynthesis C-methylase UbiE
MSLGFGYFPDYSTSTQLSQRLADFYLKIFGYPYAPRRNEVKLVFKQLAAAANQKILDIGCGDGIWTNQLATSSGAKITGLDYSAHDLKIAKKRAAQMKITNINYLKGDAQQMPFRKNTYDKVFSISTLEHIKNDAKTFKEMYRVLKPGGTAIISVPVDKTPAIIKYLVKIPSPFNKIFQTSIQQAKSATEFRSLVDKRFAHYRTYQPDRLKNKLSKIGFEIASEQFHVKLIAKLPQILFQTLKIFEWEKRVASKYSFSNLVIFPLIFPFIYPCYLLDNLLPINDGYVQVLTITKPVKSHLK